MHTYAIEDHAGRRYTYRAASLLDAVQLRETDITDAVRLRGAGPRVLAGLAIERAAHAAAECRCSGRLVTATIADLYGE